jgi:acetyl-CoA synthetase
MSADAPRLSYEALCAGFRWDLPPRFNIGAACVDRWDAAAPAMLVKRGSGHFEEITFGTIRSLSNRLGNGLRGLGVARGARVAVVLPQSLEAAVAHVAAFKIGAVSVPMSVLFGPDALHHRIADSGAHVVITDAERLDQVEPPTREAGAKLVVTNAASTPPVLAFEDLIIGGSPELAHAPTEPDTPALLIYTSGTTGPSKGALHGHRVLLGHQPGFQLSHDGFPRPGDRFWTPADWAWIGGLMNGLFSSWYHGRPIAAGQGARFDPESAVAMIRAAGIRNVFLPPTALRLMRAAGVRLPRCTLRTIMSGGEVLGTDTHQWAREALGVSVNEIYGQTEANYVIGNSQEVWPVRPGSMGRAYPGHNVDIREGEIVIRLPDPVGFLSYWNQPEATADKTADGLIRTGDRGRRDDDGYYWFEGRVDDVISSGGYRIGPEEVEQCLTAHPAIALAAAIGVPDETRGEVVKAFVVLRDGKIGSDALAGEIQEYVRTRLAAYEYPRQLEFVDSLPLTVTGKIRRAELRRLEALRQSDSKGYSGRPRRVYGSDPTSALVEPGEST